MAELVLRPVISEKSMAQAAKNVYTFEIPMTANKIEVTRAINDTFKVTTQAVRIVVSKGKVKRFKGITGRRSNTKKAYVTVKKGQSIKIFETEAEDQGKKDKK